jgi:large subunit ribosomal protein L21
MFSNQKSFITLVYMTFAIVETGGKQYRVSPGQKLKVEKLAAEVGSALSLDKVLLVSDGEDVKVGTPYLEGVKVEAKVLSQGRHDKLIVFKYHSKTRYKKKKGHRQHYTELEVVSVNPHT